MSDLIAKGIFCLALISTTAMADTNFPDQPNNGFTSGALVHSNAGTVAHLNAGTTEGVTEKGAAKPGAGTLVIHNSGSAPSVIGVISPPARQAAASVTIHNASHDRDDHTGALHMRVGSVVYNSPAVPMGRMYCEGESHTQEWQLVSHDFSVEGAFFALHSGQYMAPPYAPAGMEVHCE